MAGQECRTRLFRTGCVPYSGQENEMARFKGQQSVCSPVCLCSWDSIPVFMLGAGKGHVVGNEQNEVSNAEKCWKNAQAS